MQLALQIPRGRSGALFLGYEFGVPAWPELKAVLEMQPWATSFLSVKVKLADLRGC